MERKKPSRYPLPPTLLILQCHLLLLCPEEDSWRCLHRANGWGALGLPTGKWVAYWEQWNATVNEGVWGQVYEENGTATGEPLRVGCSNLLLENPPYIGKLDDGFIVVAGSYGICGQRWNNKGQTSSFLINSDSESSGFISTLTPRKNIFTFYSIDSMPIHHIFTNWFQVTDVDGKVIVQSTQWTVTADIDVTPSAVTTCGKGVVLIFESVAVGGICGQRFDELGNMIGDMFVISY
eukprot:TRINITY_DN5901_c0_g1_i1.p1 TRINITY_DN5901_c0_g1~~TRINITY_DN5901_c0_g1_i1.p1  ORF type:complete len:236 (+),score=27.47 TRINITY_DN5901_c0_g1_i1:353-1060(+)